MASIPSYLLGRLLIKESVQSVQDGFQFALKNTLYPATLTALVQAEVDGEVVGAENILAGKDQEGLRKATELSYQNALPFGMGETLWVKVLGKKLDPGEHKVVLTVSVLEAGRITIPLTVTL